MLGTLPAGLAVAEEVALLGERRVAETQLLRDSALEVRVEFLPLRLVVAGAD